MRFNVHLPNLCINTMNGYIETFNTDPPLYGMLYSYIGYDADIYILTGDDELVPISFMEMIEMYAETGFYAIYYDVADPVPLPPGTDTDPLLLKIVVIAP